MNSSKLKVKNSELDSLIQRKRLIRRKTLRKKIIRRRIISPFQPGILKINNLPFGFFEDELKAYFSQFGKVLNTFVARHKRTSRLKDFAYVKFAHIEVAKIAARSMNNYLMYDKVLKCKIISSTRSFDKLIKKKSLHKLSTRLKYKMIMNKDRLESKNQELIKRKLNKLKKNEKSLEELGIKFKCIVLLDD